MNDFNAGVIAEFRANGGKVGGPFEGRDNMMLMTTVGAKSGRAVTNPLVFVRDGEGIVLIASNGGADRNPAWYHNLRANPEFEIEIGVEKFRAKAEVVTGAQRDALYARMVEVMPQFADYEANTSRVIPVFVAHRQG